MLKVSRILHAGYVFECESTQILFDPIFENPFSRNCYAFPDVRFDCDQIKKLRPNAVFISHYHDDHWSMESLSLLDHRTPIYAFCIFEELFTMIRQLGFTEVHSLTLDVPVTIGPIEVIPRRALDADVDSIFHIKAAGLNVLNVVDSWIDEPTLNLLSKTSWDMVLWPFQTMRELEVISPLRAAPAPLEIPAEWVDQLKVLNPRSIVPSSCQFLQESWSWYNNAFFPVSYRQFADQIKAALPQTEIVRMNPSVSVTLTSDFIEKSPSLPWMEPVGDQDVDYEYLPDLQPPKTSEIAQRFPALSREEFDEVLEYCRSGLIEKYQSMETPMDPYFEEPRVWQLSLYDHKGRAVNFLYRIDGAKIEELRDSEEPIAWLTEVSVFKLHAALKNGESLTSMYMRINDQVFTDEIERQIKDADLVEDPLVRCLFNGAFGSYQAAQLRHLSEAQIL